MGLSLKAEGKEQTEKKYRQTLGDPSNQPVTDPECPYSDIDH